MSAKKEDDKKKSFEEYFEEVEDFVKKVEKGDLSLTALLEEYEKGVASLKNCYQTLNQAEKKIEVLRKDFEGGFKTEDFESDS